MSKVVEEFIMARCEEILSKDEQYQKYNEEILKVEKEILPMLSIESKDKFLKIDELTMKLINHMCTVLLRQFYDNY